MLEVRTGVIRIIRTMLEVRTGVIRIIEPCWRYVLG